MMDGEQRFELPEDALVTFLYLLMRDLLPVGKVRRLIDEACSAEHPTFSAPELHGLAARYAMDLGAADVVDAEVEEAPEEEEGAPLVQHIVGATGGRLLVGTPDGELAGADFTPEMKAFLDLFDDRISRLPSFVAAVNEAAAHGAYANDETAKVVADRARELNDTEGYRNG
jgi:hypothetical protein